MEATHRHVTRDIEVAVLDTGDGWVKFKVLRYDSDPGPGETKDGTDSLSTRTFNAVFRKIS